MNRSKYPRYVLAAFLSGMISLPAFAQEKDKDAKASSQNDMMAMMMELMKPGENHKLLAKSVGTWTYSVKTWMSPDPNAAPLESTGSAVFRETMGGRFVMSEHTGKMPMPGPDGKMTDMDFKGTGIDGYDNAKKKFVSSWVDNMGTGILNLEGSYDATKKTFTYLGESEMMPGMKSKVRLVLKITDNDHHTMEFYEDRGGTDFKVMQIEYTRKS
jgi:hypothetical protein